jgi:hypothetical protein
MPRKKPIESDRKQFYFVLVPLAVADDVEARLERLGVVFHRFVHPDDEDTIEFDIQADPFLADIISTIVQNLIGKYEVIDLLKPFVGKRKG